MTRVTWGGWKTVPGRMSLMLATMVLVAFAVGALSEYESYNTALREQRARLAEIAESQARLMEAVARHDTAYAVSDFTQRRFEATLSLIEEAHERSSGLGRTGELVLVRREGDAIVFLSSQRAGGNARPDRIPMASALGEPIHHALLGQSGTLIGVDYSGERVLAAYEPVNVLNVGLVAKIDLAEIRARFYRTGTVVLVGALGLIGLGVLLFKYVGNPIIHVLQVEVAERKRAEEELGRHREHLEELVTERTTELQAANEELEAFAYSVSHDLRGPLRAIAGFSRLLQEEKVAQLDAEGRRLLGVVQENAAFMDQLIDDMLELSRVGRQALVPQSVDMNQAVARSLQTLRQQNPHRDLAVTVMDLPQAIGDPMMIQQVWTNLLSNAVKFTRTRDRPVIQVSATAEPGEHVYTVKDNGVGFDMSYVDKLFGLFQRLHGRDEFEGTGVGLAIVKRIVERLGGRVWAEGEIDSGATFYFALPGDGGA